MAAAVKHKPVEQMTAAEFAAAMADPLWRLSNLYWIKTKSAEESEDGEEDEGLVVKFVPNRYQRKLLRKMHHRNIILKARQLGFTTLIQMLFLDCALFRKNIRCGVIAHTDDAAQKIFKKIKFAYDMLPEELRKAVPLKSCNSHEMELANGSSITVATSMRSDTIHYLHISEFGKICAKFPHRAEEIITGTIPAVPNDGLIFIESTAEGRSGAFFKMCGRAEALAQMKKKLSKKEYAFHFFAWHEASEYVIDPDGVLISKQDHEYFDELEAKLGKAITLAQRAWWVSTRDNDFAGEDSKMWQEYPSTPEEAFKQAKKGAYFGKQLAAARKEKRIRSLPVIPSVPCFTFWDIGSSDGTAVWVVQRIGNEWRCIHFIEGWGEPYSYFVGELQALGLIWDCMFLPHDAAHERQGEKTNKSPQQMLQDLMPGARWEVVPRIEDINWGIQQTRDIFPVLWFDEERCKEGLAHLENYSRKWNQNQEVWSDQPDKAGGHSEAADALRQLAQAHAWNLINVNRGPSAAATRRQKSKRAGRSWRTA